MRVAVTTTVSISFAMSAKLILELKKNNTPMINKI